MHDSETEATIERFPLSRRELGLIAALWLIYAFVSIGGRLLDRGSGGIAQLTGVTSVALVEALGWMLITLIVFTVANRIDSEQNRARQIFIYVVIGVVFVVAMGWLATELRRSFTPFGGPGGGNRLADSAQTLVRRRRGGGSGGGRGGPPIWYGITNALVLYLGVVSAALARTWSRRYHLRREEAARREARLGEQLAEARLDALRRQLDPHFLFNTLNTMSALVERDPRGVRRMITRLGELLRHSMERGGEAETTLRDELALLNRYVEIMQVRFQGRLTVDVRASEDVLDAQVPSMVLQPLVENAIKYGVERATGNGEVVIEATRAGDQLVLRVVDNGPGIAEGGSGTGGTGVGLRNTRARLEQLYGSAQRLVMTAAPAGGTIAEIVLPYHVRPVSGGGVRGA